MDKEVLRTIANVEIFPVIALAIFFIFFIVMIYRVMRSNREEEKSIASIPLVDGTIQINHAINNPSQDH